MISTNIYLFINVVIVLLMRTEGGRLALFVTFLGFRFFVMPLTAWSSHSDDNFTKLHTNLFTWGLKRCFSRHSRTEGSVTFSRAPLLLLLFHTTLFSLHRRASQQREEASWIKVTHSRWRKSELSTLLLHTWRKDSTIHHRREHTTES